MLYYFLYELGINQDVQAKLHNEISSILKRDEAITDDHLAKMKYLKHTLKETLR